MMHTVMRFAMLLLALFFLQGCENRPMPIHDVASLNEAARKDPNLFNGKLIANAALNGTYGPHCTYGVELENMVIRNLIIRNTSMMRAYFKNVTFVDCDFIRVDFRDSRFENVKFIRGSISGYDRTEENFKKYQTNLAPRRLVWICCI